ncbi:MAG TPA: hypothetical protein VGM39_02420 [Kofleriaceae bacterium]|jgi:hypothetical protein
MRAAILVLALATCAPSVDGPVEKQRAIDQQDATALRAQLAALPGAIAADVVIHRGVADPLAAVNTVAPTTVSAVVVVDDQADRAATSARAEQLVRASTQVMPTIVIAVGAHRHELASLGPFVVDAASKGPLKATLAIGLALIAALAGWIALRSR